MSLVSENSELPAAYAVGGLLPDRDLFSLGGPVGRSADNDRADVIKAQILLGNTGYYDLAGLGATTGWAGGGLDDAIRRFQTDHGLAPDGVLLPLAAAGIGRNGERSEEHTTELQSLIRIPYAVIFLKQKTH